MKTSRYGITISILMFLFVMCTGSVYGAETPKYGGILKVFGNPAPTTLFIPKIGTAVGAKQAASIACESLGRYDKNYAMRPYLAKEIKLDAKTMTVTITLPEGVKFHDGSDLTSEVVVWNLNEWMKAGYSKLFGEPTITSSGKYSCVLKMSTWVNNIVDLVGEINIISKQSYDQNGGEAWYATHLVGTGPFKLSKYVEGSLMTFEKNTNYRQKGLPFLDGVELIFIKDTAASLAAFRAGDLDTYQPNSTNGAALLKEADSLGISRIDNSPAIGSQSRCIFFNSLDKSSPFFDVRVRQAFIYALDREAFSKALTGGFGIKIDQFANPGVWAYNKDVVGYNFNPEKAKALLKEAGYPNGFDCTIKSAPSIAPDLVAVQSYLAKVGIVLKIEQAEWPVIWEAYVKGWKDLIYGASPTDPDASIMMEKMFLTGGDFSGSSLKPPDVLEQVKIAAIATTQSEKQAAVLRAQKLITDKYALACHIYSSPVLMFAKKIVMDSNMAQVSRYQWTPELCWIKK